LKDFSQKLFIRYSIWFFIECTSQLLRQCVFAKHIKILIWPYMSLQGGLHISHGATCSIVHLRDYCKDIHGIFRTN